MTSQAALRTPEFAAAGWWRGLPDAAAPHSIDVKVDAQLQGTGCWVTHVDLLQQPHVVRFRRDLHTFLVYDAVSYLNGVRSVEGLRLMRSGPMGDAVDVIPAGAQFEGIADQGSRISCTMIAVDPDFGLEEDGAWLPMRSALRPALGLKSPLAQLLGQRVRAMARSGASATGSRYIEAAATLLMHEMYDALKAGGAGPRSQVRGGLSSHTQRKIRDYLQENLTSKVDLDTLASNAGLSRFHFSRAFKKSFGVPPCRYLTQLRIAKAAELLRETRRPITDIALELGFSTSADFARAFRHTMNTTPREYREHR